MTREAIRRTKFRMVLRGYDPRQVDARLRAITESLNAGGAVPDFRPALGFDRVMRGYDPRAVDHFLDRLALEQPRESDAGTTGCATAPRSAGLSAADDSRVTTILCAECGRVTTAGALCAWCNAPLAGLPSAIADDPAGLATGARRVDAKPLRSPQQFVWAMVVGVLLSAFCAYAMVLNVHAFLTQGTPAQEGINYQTPGTLAGNLAIWGTPCLGGLAAAIWALRRRISAGRR